MFNKSSSPSDAGALKRENALQTALQGMETQKRRHVAALLRDICFKDDGALTPSILIMTKTQVP
jgi:hypothetical protein